MHQKLDTIFINDLIIPCLIGVFDYERTGKQNLIINIELFVDTHTAGKTDNINDTVSYSDITKSVTEIVSNSQFYLLEKLAQAIADICLHDNRVKQVKIHIEKPKGLKLAKSAAIAITRYAK
ncbi:MAG TPA: dihydroneopterin aldolase [Candidatus Sulfotelmatobacter sp.]|jgi:FolB domain-containing protein|nr:dihydroneopterin aldolase [Candidatus Sulfotelmatobacter sp.]